MPFFWQWQSSNCMDIKDDDHCCNSLATTVCTRTPLMIVIKYFSSTCQDEWNYYYHEAVDPRESNLITKVRISIGASSTTSFRGSTGPPLSTFGSSCEPSTFQTNLFLSISSLSWFADKLISAILWIWIHIFKGSNVSTYINSDTCLENIDPELKSFSRICSTFLFENIFFSSTLARLDRSLSSPI